MLMSGITDKAEFDTFRKTIDWRGYAERGPALIKGRADEVAACSAFGISNGPSVELRSQNSASDA